MNFKDTKQDKEMMRTSLFLPLELRNALEEYRLDMHKSMSKCIRDELTKVLVRKGYLQED